MIVLCKETEVLLDLSERQVTFLKEFLQEGEAAVYHYSYSPERAHFHQALLAALDKAYPGDTPCPERYC